MTATRQGMSSAEIDQIVAQRVTDAIEAIAIYETKIRMTHDPVNQVIRQETLIEKNANNKRKFENQPKDNRVPQQPPFKKPDVARAYTIEANGKKAYAGNLPYCNKSARLGCAKTKVATWDDLAFKLIILGWNVKHRILQNVDPWLKFKMAHSPKI
ncbi:hypothetical protein Tco_0045239 [Tanacetum coccineum]